MLSVAQKYYLRALSCVLLLNTLNAVHPHYLYELYYLASF